MDYRKFLDEMREEDPADESVIKICNTDSVRELLDLNKKLERKPEAEKKELLTNLLDLWRGAQKGQHHAKEVATKLFGDILSNLGQKKLTMTTDTPNLKIKLWFESPELCDGRLNSTAETLFLTITTSDEENLQQISQIIVEKLGLGKPISFQFQS